MSPIQLPCELPLPYSDELCSEYERVGAAVVDQVIEVYEKFLANPTLDSRKWKVIKKREKMRIYHLRERDPPSALHKPLPAGTASPKVLAQADWSPMVKLLVTGTTLGSLDDAMYGSLSTTDLSALKRSMTIQDDFYHHKTLRHIRPPTVDDPFTYVGLKWNARSSYIASLIKARDMVFLQSSGFRQMLINGAYERVGYTLFHSVDLPEVTPLSSQGILRSKYSACVLLRQQSSGVVEVFLTTSLQPAGELMFKVTAFQAAEALSAICNVTESAMKKKLVWMQAARAYGAPNVAMAYMPRWRSMRQSFSGNFKITCDQCSRELKALSKTFKCDICTIAVCSRCITTCQLVFGDKIDELEYLSTPTCKGCITTALHLDNSRALAVYEFVQPFDRIRKNFPQPQPEIRKQQPVQRLSLSQASAAPTELSLETLSLSSIQRMNELSTANDEEDEVIGAQQRSTTTPKRFSDEITRERLRLWDQINHLCIQAEETYRIAVRQTRDIQRSHSHTSSAE
jgi:hypothetical protein